MSLIILKIVLITKRCEFWGIQNTLSVNKGAVTKPSVVSPFLVLLGREHAKKMKILFETSGCIFAQKSLKRLRFLHPPYTVVNSVEGILMEDFILQLQYSVRDIHFTSIFLTEAKMKL